MKWFKKTSSDVFFLLFAVIYLFIRQWPYGGAMQTVVDILIVVTSLLMAVKYFFFRRNP